MTAAKPLGAFLQAILLVLVAWATPLVRAQRATCSFVGGWRDRFWLAGPVSVGALEWWVVVFWKAVFGEAVFGEAVLGGNSW